tara:strand:- start:58 stop:336 length:279 start_codon:yes stop_codon:yes gene_type:complete
MAQNSSEIISVPLKKTLLAPLPLWISYSLYRFESNVRSATVLGIVGAGGIGMILWEVIRGFQYAETAAIVIIIVVSVSILDMISQRLRKLVI